MNVDVKLSDDEVRRIARAVATELAELQPRRAELSEFVPAAEAARMLGCSTRQVRRLVAVRRLEAAKVNPGGSSRLLVSRASVARVLREGRR